MSSLSTIINTQGIDANSYIACTLSNMASNYFENATAKTFLVQPLSLLADWVMIDRSTINGSISSIMNGTSTVFDNKTICDGVLVEVTKDVEIKPIQVFYNNSSLFFKVQDSMYVTLLLVEKKNTNIPESFILELESMLFGLAIGDQNYVYKAIQRIDIDMQNNISENKMHRKTLNRKGRIKPCQL